MVAMSIGEGLLEGRRRRRCSGDPRLSEQGRELSGRMTHRRPRRRVPGGSTLTWTPARFSAGDSDAA